MTSPLDCSESSATAQGKLRSHAYQAPTSDDVRAALRTDTTIDTERLWARVCAEAGVSAVEPLSPLQLDRVIALLSLEEGRVGLIGRAMGVRVSVYRELGLRGADAPAPRFDWARVAMNTLLRGRVSLEARIQELVSLDPFAPEVRPHLDQAASRVARRLGSVMGGITIVLDDAQCVVGSSGSSGTWMDDAGGAPIEWSFCSVPVRTREPYVVNDLGADVMHRINPTVLHDGVRAYAGAPLITSAGEVLGACCVLDVRPRNFTDEDVAVLVEEAANVVAELERRRAEKEARAAVSGS